MTVEPRPPGPLRALRVIEFATLLPGPFATLLLAEAGATVIKVERPTGDELRRGASPAHFPMLNRGKTSVVADLKRQPDRERVLELVAGADVLVEQFRPGVMDRLGIGYAEVSRRNPGLVYCSLTGFGQTGARAHLAGHDLNYVAATGLLSLVRDGDGRAVLPPTLVADIAGGTYPAVINILLALMARERSGRGTHLDIAMTDNVWPMQYWSMAQGLLGKAPEPGGERLTGGSPRYQLYRTSDGRWVAAAPLEQRFWDRFAAAIGLPPDLRDDARRPGRTISAVRDLIEARDSSHWRKVFAEADCCCSIVATVPEAVTDPAFAARGLFAASVSGAGEETRYPAMPVPLSPDLRTNTGHGRSPGLGELPLAEATWRHAQLTRDEPPG
jgi:alpha-methylacyl-CoA racemase